MKREKGFTMIELLVVFIILSVLLGLAIPGFSSWFPKYRLRGAARDIYSNLQLAKMTAVKDRARCAVLFDVPNSYRVVRISPGPDNIYGNGDDPTPVALKTVSFSEYGSVGGNGSGTATGGVGGEAFDNNVTFQDDGIVFDSRGMVLRPTGAVSTGGYVYLQNNKNNAFAVGVLGGGVIALQRWNGTAWQQ